MKTPPTLETILNIPPTRRAFINAGDLHRTAERLLAATRWVMDADGKVIMPPGLTMEADIQAAAHLILAFIGTKVGAIIETTDKPHPLGPLHRFL